MAVHATGELPGAPVVALDLTGKRSRSTSESLVGIALAACGAISLLTTVGIIAVLIQEALRFFSSVKVTDFLFGTTWTALFKTPQYGVLPLVGGTLVIALIDPDERLFWPYMPNPSSWLLMSI